MYISYFHRFIAKKVKVKVTLEQAMKAHGEQRYSSTLSLNLAPDGGVERHALPQNNPVAIVQEAGWAPRPVWTSADNLAATGIRSPYQPVASRCTDDILALVVVKTHHKKQSQLTYNNKS